MLIKLALLEYVSWENTEQLGLLGLEIHSCIQHWIGGHKGCIPVIMFTAFLLSLYHQMASGIFDWWLTLSVALSLGLIKGCVFGFVAAVQLELGMHRVVVRITVPSNHACLWVIKWELIKVAEILTNWWCLWGCQKQLRGDGCSKG